MFKRQRGKRKTDREEGEKGGKKGQEKRWEMGEDNLQERKKTLFQKGTTQEKLSPKGYVRKTVGRRNTTTGQKENRSRRNGGKTTGGHKEILFKGDGRWCKKNC